MIKFNELRITPDGKQLIIDAQIKELMIYKDVLLDSVVIDTQDTYIENGPSTTPVYSVELSQTNKNVYVEDCQKALVEEDLGDCLLEDLEAERHIHLTLTAGDLGVSNLNEFMFFIYVRAKGTPSSDTPCGMDNSLLMGIVFNKYPMYRKSMVQVKSLEDKCDIPSSLIDSILRMKSVEISLKAWNIPQAIKYWNKFFRNNKVEIINTCNCGK